MKLKRTLYMGYYLKQLDREKFRHFTEVAKERSGRSRSSLTTDAIRCVFRYNISLLEYFQFRFFELSDAERRKWAGTGFMYEYQKEMNPPGSRIILDDKRLFYQNYKQYFRHRVASAIEMKKDKVREVILSNPSGKVVFKASDGKCGAQVEIMNSEEARNLNLVRYMKEKGYDLVEEFIRQHDELNRLSPTAVNTVRVFTQLNSRNEAELLGCRLRISVNSPVDNMAAGNLAAPIDEQTGLVNGPGVYSDIGKSDCEVHPATGAEIRGFQVPYWDEIVAMCREAAELHPQNRSIGWDVVITNEGPGLIEGNHDWCKLLWQLPVKEGLKSKLTRHQDELPAIETPEIAETV